MPPLITLTTDFGDASPYAAVLKGVILSINPAARVLDLSHRIRPQDLRHASYFLATAVPHFPSGTIHVCVVDPGVGSERAAIYADDGSQRLVGPNNGVFTGVLRQQGCRVARKLSNPGFWRHPVSDTFHGRDIFAPVAAHLSLGVSYKELAPEDLEDLVLLPAHAAVTFGNRWQGEVQFVDDFGNLITNIPAAGVKSLPARVSFGGEPPHPLRWVRTYAEAAPGELVSLFSSDGFFEVAEVNGNAARRLGLREGVAVEVEFE